MIARQLIECGDKWSDSQRAWLAGVLDCDGCISYRKTGATSRYALVVSVSQGDMRSEIVKRCQQLFGGLIRHKVWRKRANHATETIWSANGSKYGIPVLAAAYPFLIAKQKQALLMLRLETVRHAMPEWRHFCAHRQRPESVTKMQDAAYQAMKIWNTRGIRDEPLTVSNLPFGGCWFVEGTTTKQAVIDAGWQAAHPIMAYRAAQQSLLFQ